MKISLINIKTRIQWPKYFRKTWSRKFFWNYKCPPSSAWSLTCQNTWQNVFYDKMILYSMTKCVFPLFPFVSHCFRRWLKISLKVYDVINWLNKNLKTHFAWYLQKESVSWSIDKVLNTENLHGKKHAENMPKKLVPDPFWILANSSKQSMYARNSFENEIFWMRIINLTWF